MKNNILILSPQPYFAWRGSPIRVNYNLRTLANSGYSVDLLTLPIGEEVNIHGVGIMRLSNPFRIKNISIGPSFTKLFFDVLMLVKAIGLSRKHKYHIIHGIEEGGAIAVLLCLFNGSKSIYEKHSDISSHKKGFFINMLLSVYKEFERFTIKNADAVICTGAGLYKQVCKIKDPSMVLNIADNPTSAHEPDDDEIIMKRAQIDCKPNEVLVTFIGSFASYQGISLLMESALQVLTEDGQTKFLIIGGNTTEIKKWQQQFKDKKLNHRINFIGMISPDSVPGWLKASDILISTRLSGVNSPLKLIDYLKAGRPIVATENAANCNVLISEVALFAKTNPKDFAFNIIKLAHNNKMRVEMGLQGRKLFDHEYSFHKFEEKLLGCYSKLYNPEPNNK